MNTDPSLDSQQAKLWNGAAGNAWVEAQQVTDLMFQPFEDLLVQAVSAAGSVSTVLDIGCGAGSTTLAVAQLLGEQGRCLGVDISEPLITAARARTVQRTGAASFLVANAEFHHFEPAGFDMILSRFGVMFFEDPVRAFRNLRHAAKQDGELCCLTWRSPSENPFMLTAERAAAPLLPNLPARQPDAPGQFAFASSDRVQRILDDSGWTNIDIQPIDVVCSLPEKDLALYFTQLGPVGLALRDTDERTRERVVQTVRAAFDPSVQGTEVRFNAACWMVRARA